MSFIFDATKPVSPERQKVAQAMLQRQQMDSLMAGPEPVPQNVGQGLQALGEGIFDGLQGRALQHQATAPTDAWADMRQTGNQVPNTNWEGGPMGSFGGGGIGLLGDPLVKRIFG